MTNVLRPTIALAAVVTTIAALLIAGCGGSSKSGDGTAAASGKSPMVAQADALCKALNERREAINKELGAVTSVAELRKVAEVAPFIEGFERNTIAKLRQLTPPSEIAAAWQKILAGAQLLYEHANKLGAAASAKNLRAVEVLIKEDEKSEKELIPIAKKAGFEHCGRNS